MPKIHLPITITFFAIMLAGCSVFPDDDNDIASPAAGMVNLGQTVEKQGDALGAAGFYQHALERDPKNIAAYKGLAAILDHLGDHAGAAAQYNAALQIKPHDANLHRGYGKALLALEQPKEARDQFQAALDDDSDDMKSMNGLGIALDRLGDHAAAEEKFKAVLKSEPDNLSTINNLAYAFILDNNPLDAIALLEPRIHDQKATPALRQNLALAYGLAGMNMDAERIGKIDLKPNQVKANLDYYKRMRAEMAVSTIPYAELGTYATEALAAAQIEKMRPQLNHAAADLKPVIQPEITAPGGTPRFTVRMMGCTKPDEVQNMCGTLKQSGIPCVPHGGE